MTRINIQLELPHGIERVWDRLTDWKSHSAWIPKTLVTISEQTNGVGTQFIGITRIGPLRLDDPMTVAEFQAPSAGRASCTIIKTGSVLGGTAGFTLSSVDASTTRLDWFEDIHLKPQAIFWWTAPFIVAIGTIAFRSALKAFARTL
jgi:carbon monoxide dehydrogenase subunit G